MASINRALTRQSYPAVAYLQLKSDYITMNDQQLTYGTSRDRTYRAVDQAGDDISGISITERVLSAGGGLNTTTTNVTSSSASSQFGDQVGLNAVQTSVFSINQTVYQYFVTTIPGTSWSNVPTAVRGFNGEMNMVFAITLSGGPGSRSDVRYNGDAGMWNADGSPRLPLCDR